MPTMQRRHYETIARIIRDLGQPSEGYALYHPSQVAKHFASALSPTNPNFNRDRFLKACGVQD